MTTAHNEEPAMQDAFMMVSIRIQGQRQKFELCVSDKTLNMRHNIGFSSVFENACHIFLNQYDSIWLLLFTTEIRRTAASDPTRRMKRNCFFKISHKWDHYERHNGPKHNARTHCNAEPWRRATSKFQSAHAKPEMFSEIEHAQSFITWKNAASNVEKRHAL